MSKSERDIGVEELEELGTHFSITELCRFVRGKAGHKGPAIAAHLEGCEVCSGWVRTLKELMEKHPLKKEFEKIKGMMLDPILQKAGRAVTVPFTTWTTELKAGRRCLFSIGIADEALILFLPKGKKGSGPHCHVTSREGNDWTIPCPLDPNVTGKGTAVLTLDPAEHLVQLGGTCLRISAETAGKCKRLVVRLIGRGERVSKTLIEQVLADSKQVIEPAERLSFLMSHESDRERFPPQKQEK